MAREAKRKARKKETERTSPGRDFLFPLRWRKKCPRKKFTIADEATLSKILSTPPAIRQPEFQGKEYVPGIKNEDKLLYKCSEPNCKGAFTAQAALQTHKLKHLNRMLRCDFCNRLFKTDDERTKHLNEFHPDLEKTPGANPLQCKKCGKIPKDKLALWRHVRESHREEPTPCPHCGVLFNRPDNMKEHIKYKHPPEGVPPRIFSCEICDRAFTHKSILRCHIRSSHRGNKVTIRCVLCNITYSCKESYQRHMKRHVKLTLQTCTICDRRMLDMYKHRRSRIHKMREKQLKRIKIEPLAPNEDCEEDSLEMKVDTAVGANRFTQEELIESCRKKVIKIVLRRVDERKSRYTFSGNPTPQRTVDGEHLNCVYCSESLPNLEAVTTHEAICFMKIRSRKLNICPECNKEFEKPFKLKLHMRTHSDDRPFPCSYCNSKFKSTHLKAQHEKAVHFGIR